MKRFPFKILFLSIFLPPLCYVITLQVLEGYLQKRETSKLNQLIINNYEALYEGRYSVREEINRNLGEYLSKSLKYSLGIRMQILVKTGDDRILYPTQFKKELRESHPEGEFSSIHTESLNYMEVAAENFKILNEGLILSVNLQIKHNSWLSNGILVFYVFIFVLFVQKVIVKRIGEAEKEQEMRIQRYSDQLIQAERRFKDAKAKEENYLSKINELKKDKKDLSKDVNELLEEMERLDKGLESQRELKEEMELEVLQFKEDLERLKGKEKRTRKKKKKIVTVGKRLNTLYKNITFSERAIEGFFALPDEYQLKAEEIIHKINEDDALVTIRRKVFGKGGKMNMLEVDFSYSGRLYFQKDARSKIRILAIGTKNTQEKDLAYLESMKERNFVLPC